MNNPKVSIVIQTYGRAEYLKGLIESVRFSTPQGAYEFVIVSSDLPESEKIKRLSQQSDVNLILADARKEWQLRKKSSCYYLNLGIKNSKKEWVFLINDDMRFDENWYKEFTKLLSNPDNSNVGMIIVSSHLGEVKHGYRIKKLGQTKKGDGPWKDLYLSDFCIMKKSVLEEIGFYDEKLDWFVLGVDTSLAVEFLTNKDTIISDKIKIDHFIAEENRDANTEDGFTDFHYLLRKWDAWCKKNDCQYTWRPGVKPYTIPNRVKSFLKKQRNIMRFYKKYI